MKIVVFIKQVPDTDKVRIDPKTGNLCRDGVKSILNPMDANALETALELKDKYGALVAAVAMGPFQARSILKKALGMGCDEAYLLSDRAFGGADTLATSYVLAQAAKKIGSYDLLLFGQHATDGDTAQTGPAVAAQLDIPQVTLAASAEVDGGWVYCRRNLGSRCQDVRAKLPAAVFLCGDINTPRYASPINIVRAQSKPLTVWNAADLECDVSRTGTAGSPSCTKEIFEPQKQHAETVYFDGPAKKAAKALLDALEAEHLI